MGSNALFMITGPLNENIGGNNMEQIKNDIVDYLKANSFMDNNNSLKDDDSLTQNGIIDSIGLLELMDYICEKYSIEIPEDMLTPENFDSLQGITNMITKLAK